MEPARLIGSIVAFVLTAVLAPSCTAVLGLDEPTHRGDGGEQVSGGTGGGSNGGEQGSSGSNGSAGSNGAGGAVGAGGTSGSAGGAGARDGGAGGPTDAGIDAPKPACQGLVVCDDFESSPAGTVPDIAKWFIDSATTQPGAILVDGAQHVSGNNSVRVEGNRAIGPTVFSSQVPLDATKGWYMRMRVLLTDPQITGGFFIIQNARMPSVEYVLLGLQNGSLAYLWAHRPTINQQQILPSSSGELMNSYRPKGSTWFCLETMFSTGPNNVAIQTWVDGKDIPQLRADDMPTAGIDDQIQQILPDFLRGPTVGFGVWLAGTAPDATVYLDDVAVSYTRIGCN
jgi:hypothetical protein